ncbi:MAG: Rrf2 family transcriptional regulator [Ramlibacter sp.]|nr:Rrf2 family transcriptional regulator [Ramlibacter sp.]
MKLTLYTDYTLRVMIYLALIHDDQGAATIEEIARAYDISRNHLMKIVHELSTHGFIVTQRGRSGGARLARQPSEITVGSIVRMAEKDFAVVSCHDLALDHGCAVFDVCNVRHGFERATAAFLAELDAMTLDQAIRRPADARAGATARVFRIPVPDPSKPGRPAPAAARRSARPRAN